MPGRQTMPVKDAARLAQKLADELQLELVDVELVKEPTGRFLRFFVDTEKGVSVVPILQSICRWAGAYHREATDQTPEQCRKCDYGV